MRFWLSDATTTIDLGDEVKTITLGNSDRQFNVENFARSNGGYLKGFGNYSPKVFTFSRDDFITISDEQHAWNGQRNSFMQWLTRDATTYIYLNMAYSTDSITLRTKVYPTKLPKDTFNGNWNTNFDREFELISPTGFWETTTDIAASFNLTSTNEHEITLTNNGIIECAPIFNFTPISSAVLFQVKLSEGYGFRLEGTFSSGVTISFDMSNSKFYIDNNETDLTNYLTAGSPFLFPPYQSKSLFVYGSSGVFSYSFKERYI